MGMGQLSQLPCGKNPVNHGLVESPEKWRWSSDRHYLLDEPGPVRVNVGWGEISFRDGVSIASTWSAMERN